MNKLEDGEKKNSQEFHRLLKDSFKRALGILEEKRDRFIFNSKIKENCRCGWTGEREKTEIMGEQGTHYFLLCCPACGRTIRTLHPKALWI